MHPTPAVGHAGLRRLRRWAFAGVALAAVSVAGSSASAAPPAGATTAAVTAAPPGVSTTEPAAPTAAPRPRTDGHIPGTPSRRTSALAAVAAALSIATGGLVFQRLARRDASEGRTVVVVPSVSAATPADTDHTNSADSAPERAG